MSTDGRTNDRGSLYLFGALLGGEMALSDLRDAGVQLYSIGCTASA
jgi:hypothetical protein